MDELNFCFDDNDKYNTFIDKYLRNYLDNQDKYTDNNFVCKIIKKIIKKRKKILENTSKIFIIIIDQYKYAYDSKRNIINILEIFKQYNDFKYLICSSIDEDNNRGIFYDILFSNKEDANIYFFGSFDKNISFLSEPKKKIALQFSCLPKYIEEIDKEKEENMEQFVNLKFKSLKNSINSFILSKINNTNIKLYKIVKIIMNKESHYLNKNEILRLYSYLPIKYIIPYKIKNKNDLFEYKYAFPLIGNIFKDILQDCIGEINLDLFANNKNDQEMGWNFENLVHNFFKLNSRPFPDLKLRIDQEIFVDSIYEFKELTINTTYNDKNLKLEENEYIYTIKDNIEKRKLCKDIIKNEIVVLSQKPCGESYDGALLIPFMNNNNKKYYGMLLYQVTLDRKKEPFLYKDNIVDSLFKIKSRFESIFEISIQKFYFMYILYIQRKNTTQIEKM